MTRGPSDSPDYLPVEVLEWADRRSEVLELVAESLLRTGEWPQIGEMTRSLAREGRVLPLSTILERMPSPIGFVEGQPRRIVLLLFGLSLTDAGSRLLTDFVAVLRIAVERYKCDDDQEPRITQADVTQIAPDDEQYVCALGEILRREAPFLRGGVHRDGDEWGAYVTDEIVRYWDAHSPEDYLHLRAQELLAAQPPGWFADRASEDEDESGTDPSASAGLQDEIRDAFISHAGEDKDEVARPLTERLEALGHSVWFDEQQIVVGESLSESIDRGLYQSRFGVVILSPAFFAKPWPKRELAALVARETIDGERVILPVWHEIDAQELVRFSPTLADLYAARTSEGLDAVAELISQAITKRGPGPAKPAPVTQSAPAVSFPVRTAREVLDAAAPPPGSSERWDVYEGTSRLRAVVAPVPEGLRHPQGGDPRAALADASTAAREIAADWPENASLLAQRLTDGWKPMAPHIWGAGLVHSELEQMLRRGSAGASFMTRGGVLCVERTWATGVTDEDGAHAFYAAREPEVAAELLVALSLADALLGSIPGLHVLDIALLFASAPTGNSLVSSERAVSGRRFGEPEGRIRPTAEVPSHYLDEGRFTPAELRAPYRLARGLLGPWLATFREEDLFDRLQRD